MRHVTVRCVLPGLRRLAPTTRKWFPVQDPSLSYVDSVIWALRGCVSTKGKTCVQALGAGAKDQGAFQELFGQGYQFFLM